MNSTYFDIFIIISYHSLNGQFVCSSQVDLGMQITFSILKIMTVLQTNIVFNNILIISSKLFFKSLHVQSSHSSKITK